MGRTGVDEEDAVGGGRGVCDDKCAAALAHVQPCGGLGKGCIALWDSCKGMWKRSVCMRTIMFVSTTGLDACQGESRVRVKNMYPVMSPIPTRDVGSHFAARELDHSPRPSRYCPTTGWIPP